MDDVTQYKKHLFSTNSPVLYTDNVKNIIDILMGFGFFTKRDLFGKNLETLKDLRDKVVNKHKKTVIHERVAEIKSYALYSEIIDTFNELMKLYLMDIMRTSHYQ